IDVIELLMIPDNNTRAANLLAGTVDVSGQLGGIDLGLNLRQQWQDGRVPFNFGSGTWVAMFPQFIDARPAILTDVRFRRALMYGIDREEIINNLLAGMSPVPHSILNPNQPQYQEIEAAIPKYGYDPRRAAQMIEELGYRKDASGAYRDAAGERLELEIYAQNIESMAKPSDAVASYWTDLGVPTTPVHIPPARVSDLEYLATFPGFITWIRTNDVDGLAPRHSVQTPLPSNNYRVSLGQANHSRYMNPEFDALLDTYFRTVPTSER